ncbi:hypothetical protein CN238_04200 [Sinorhizobium meliloti]|nr:hypothetical protein CN238_04200 [Sinorhizobium meliloti]RVH35685.1 hypothetical protein CN214_00425 [Sinorhizobium meliloti]
MPGASAEETYRRTEILLFLISVLVTEIQQRRVCGAGRVLSAQGTWSGCPVTSTGEIKQAAAVSQ